MPTNQDIPYNDEQDTEAALYAAAFLKNYLEVHNLEFEFIDLTNCLADFIAELEADL